jgi:4-aminobutyrate aminotransferase-like enzyme/Ser/Thr protein kinase RdoA (MazF antagonist)
MLIEARHSQSVTPAEAQRVAQELYGITASARILPGEFDDNFHLVAADGAEYALKIMRPNCQREFVEMQCAALQHLAALPVPRVCGSIKATADGRLVWLLSWLPGRLLAETKPHTPEMLSSLGRLLGWLNAALASFDHPAVHRELKWDLARAGWIRDYVDYIQDLPRRDLVYRVLSARVSFGNLRQSIIHGDANDHNILVSANEVTGLLDFGDLHYGATIGELAVACAYAALGKENPLSAIADVAAGYHQCCPLEQLEIEALFPLILTRLAVSVTNSAYLKTRHPGDPYVVISEEQAWTALEELEAVPHSLALYAIRDACGLPPVRNESAIVGWLKSQNCASVLAGIDLRTEPSIVFDLSVGSLLLGADPRSQETAVLTETLFRKMREDGVRVGIGRYDEARLLYTAPFFATGPHPTDERRTIHLGLDLFVEPGTPVCAPLDGTVYAFANNARQLDYGPVIILHHEAGNELEFFTLYGHLSTDSLDGLSFGQAVARGQRIGAIGAPPLNGDWPPHLHFQIITDLLNLDCDFPGVAFASQRKVWRSLSPDANIIVGVPPERFPAPEAAKAETLAARSARIGKNLSISYKDPLKIVRGWRQFLYDETGRAYLDVYNNVPLVGHSHPRVVEAAHRQMALLNTNTRYLHDNITRYAERLTALMPAPLRVCYFLNSASEANELALRLARAHTGSENIIVLDAAYHGHTISLIDISPYKFNGPGGGGRKPWVHVAALPDDYRGPYKRNDPEAGLKYAHDALELIEGPTSFIAESLPSVGGQIVLPTGYLAEVYRHVRAAGGVCIADEVQVGFGRLGDWFWGFEMQAVTPDIVVLGKPMGNGFPLAGVVTTPEIAASFDNGMEFFSTFGGNPVSCAAGLAVLDVLEEERLQENARRVGGHFLEVLRALMERHEIIGDVRGAGLFLGIELVRDRRTLEPAAEEATYVVNRLRERGILAGTDGPHHNVIKIRPPLVFREEDANLFVAVLDEVLAEDPVRTHSLALGVR